MPANPASHPAEVLPVLFTFRRCPYAIRARLALRYAGITVDFREVELRNKPASLFRLSPKGTVPVLLLTDGSVIDESLDIMRWALAQADPDGWLRGSYAQEAARWIGDNDVHFKPLLDRYKYAGRYPEQSPADHREHAIDAFVRPLDEQLRKQKFLEGSHATLADAAIFPFVRQFASVDKPWFDNQPLSGVSRWLNAWLNASLFESVMLKAPQHAGGGVVTS